MTALSQALASFLSFSYTGPVESFNQEPRQTAREATASHPGQVTREISVGTRQKHSLSLSLLWERSLEKTSTLRPLYVTNVKRSLSATELNGIGLKLNWNGLLQPFMNVLNQISTGNVLD